MTFDEWWGEKLLYHSQIREDVQPPKEWMREAWLAAYRVGEDRGRELEHEAALERVVGIPAAVEAARKFADAFRSEFHSAKADAEKWHGWVDGFNPACELDREYLALAAALKAVDEQSNVRLQCCGEKDADGVCCNCPTPIPDDAPVGHIPGEDLQRMRDGWRHAEQGLNHAEHLLRRVDAAVKMIPEGVEGHLEPLSDVIVDVRAFLVSGRVESPPKRHMQAQCPKCGALVESIGNPCNACRYAALTEGQPKVGRP